MKKKKISILINSEKIELIVKKWCKLLYKYVNKINHYLCYFKLSSEEKNLLKEICNKFFLI